MIELNRFKDYIYDANVGLFVSILNSPRIMSPGIMIKNHQ